MTIELFPRIVSSDEPWTQLLRSYRFIAVPIGLLVDLWEFGRMFEGPMIAFLARGRPVPPGNRFSIVFPAQLLPAEHKHMCDSSANFLMSPVSDAK